MSQEYRRIRSIAFATLASCLICILVFEAGNLPYTDHVRHTESFWKKLLSSPPNEIGDALAGLFGPLAFLAAAIAIVMQSFELKAQRRELELSRAVMKDQSEATTQMAGNLALQAEIFEDERKLRTETRAKDLLDQKLISLKQSLVYMLEAGSSSDHFDLHAVSHGYSTPDTELDTVQSITGFVSSCMMEIERLGIEEASLHYTPIIDFVVDIESTVRDVYEFQYELSAAQVTRLHNIEFDELGLTLEEFGNQTSNMYMYQNLVMRT